MDAEVLHSLLGERDAQNERSSPKWRQFMNEEADMEWREPNRSFETVMIENTQLILDLLGEILKLLNRERLMSQQWLSVAEFAGAVQKTSYTVREWCRHQRINASKRSSGRGRTPEWVINRDELERYQKEGLLPLMLNKRLIR